MKLKFWGVRGSIPTPEKNKMQIGGNTSCIELSIGEKRIILDMGTGIRELGKKIVNEIEAGKTAEVVIFLSHTHWDHIQGFPFFNPIYIPGVKIMIFGPEKANRHLEVLLEGQMEYDYFPVKFSNLPSKIEFHELSEGVHSLIDGVKIGIKRHIHPAIAYTYRFENEGRSIVYSTDTEHFHDVIDKRVVEISRDADLLIHDSQYTDNIIGQRLGWGHSTWKQAVKVALEAGVKKLALFHYDPDQTDDEIFAIEKEAKSLFPGSFISREGDQIEI
jgi:phosphoribosyl 1,2-cyclic phosphodiesterase